MEGAQTPVSEPRRASLSIVFITVFIDLLGFGIVLPLLPRYGQQFEADALQLGLLMASFSAMQFLFAPFWGRVSDRFGRRPILILGLAGSTFSYALFGYATSLGRDGTLLGLSALSWLFITRIAAGIAGATIPTAQAYIADVTGTKERGKGMAMIGAAFGIGFTFGPLIGAAFVSEGTAPSAMPGYVAAGLSAAALISAIFLLKESLSEESRPAEAHWLDMQSLQRAIQRPAQIKILLTIFVATLAFAQWETVLALLTKSMGLGDRDNFYVFAYIGFIMTLSQGMLVRRFLPKLGEFRMLLIGAPLMAAGLLAMSLPANYKSAAMLYVVLPIVVLGYSAVTPSLQSLLSLQSEAYEQGGILGLGQSMSAIARILGHVVGMVLLGMNLMFPFWGGGILMLAASGLVVLLRGSAHDSLSADPAPDAAA